MNDHTQQDQKRNSRGVLAVCLCWLSAILVLYVLSSGPVEMMEAKGRIVGGSSTHTFLVNLYSPFRWAYSHTLLHKPLGMYLHMWSPRQFDSKGNRK
jgi:hypothetical protein